MAFSLDWYSSNSAMIWRIMTCMGSSPISCQLHAVLRQLADVGLQLKVVAEEAREAVNHDNIERRGLRRPRLDHALKLRPAVVRGGSASLHKGIDKLVTARGATGAALLALVGDRDIMLGLPRRRDAQIEGGRASLSKSGARSWRMPPSQIIGMARTDHRRGRRTTPRTRPPRPP